MPISKHKALQVDISKKVFAKQKCDIIHHEPQASMYINKYFPWVTVHWFENIQNNSVATDCWENAMGFYH